MNVYSIKDLKAAYFMQPFYARNHAEALRHFTSAINDSRDPNNLLAKYPSDFDIYFVGIFEEQIGRFASAKDNEDAREQKLGNGADFLQTQQ